MPRLPGSRPGWGTRSWAGASKWYESCHAIGSALLDLSLQPTVDMTLDKVLQFLGNALVIAGIVLVGGAISYERFQPVAITLGPSTTVYFNEPTLDTRVHEAIHRRQMRDKSSLGQLASALRYTTDYGYRLDEEAEAKAGEVCLQIHRFSSELPAYTTARSKSQAEAYRAWAWERMGARVPDRVGAKLQGGERCAEILRGVVLDVPPGSPLSGREAERLATFQFLQSYGSSSTDRERWKARLELASWADPVRWQLPPDLPDFELLNLARAEAPEHDSTITEMEAGRALHRLTYATAQRMYLQLLPALPGYRGSRLLDPEEAAEVTGIQVEDWASTLIEKALSASLNDATVSYLARVDRHAANADLETFALAPEADIVGARYHMPLRVGWDRMVLSDLDPGREAFRAQYGRVALALARGDPERGERILRTTLAGALQLARNAPFEVDALEGLRLVLETLGGLERLLIAEGRGDEVTWRGLPETRERWIGVGSRAALFSADPAELFGAMPALAQDRGVPLAFRRFAYRQVALWDVCLGRRTDPLSGVRHRAWTAAVEVGLAARESDAELLKAIRGTVRRLLKASAVPPEQICAPTSVVRPEARVAIMGVWPRARGSVDAAVN